MQHLGCLVQLTVDLDEAATINEVSIKCGDENGGEFITKGYIDLSSQIPVIQASTQEDKSNTISIVLENLSVTAEETATVYFMMAPINLEGKTIDVTVAMDGGDTKTYQTAGKDYIAGKAYAIALTNKDVLLTYNLVDLGLPSGTLWADRNVGADSPEASGNYFAWGDVSTTASPGWTDYKWCEGSDITMTKYCTDDRFGTVDNKTVLELEDDAAYINMGMNWCMPTEKEYSELISECTWAWITQNGTAGYKVTGPNGNSIFFPAAGYRMESNLQKAGTLGYWWSSSLYEAGPYGAAGFKIDSNGYSSVISGRDCARTVRAVVKAVSAPKANKVDLGLPSGTLWADRNVGADSPEAYGDYFAWGETSTKSTYNWSTYKWCQGSSRSMTKYCTKSFYGTVDSNTVLDLKDDAAYVNMGADWRMPTYD
jgi:hypothetical protein